MVFVLEGWTPKKDRWAILEGYVGRVGGSPFYRISHESFKSWIFGRTKQRLSVERVHLPFHGPGREIDKLCDRIFFWDEPYEELVRRVLTCVSSASVKLCGNPAAFYDVTQEMSEMRILRVRMGENFAEKK